MLTSEQITAIQAGYNARPASIAFAAFSTPGAVLTDTTHKPGRMSARC